MCTEQWGRALCSIMYYDIEIIMQSNTKACCKIMVVTHNETVLYLKWGHKTRGRSGKIIN